MNIGIEAIEFYSPKTYVDQQDLEKHYGVPQGKYTKGLGQLQLSFATAAEDVNSLALTALNNLLKNNNIHPSQVGRLEVGTETLVDKSKSTKTVLMELFKGFNDIEGATSINACYGATNALLNTLNWMSSPSWDGRYGIVVAVDIAVYQEGPARPTGGAGAIAILIGKNAKVIINPIRASFIDNEWDFYKPIPSSEYPVVDGKYSMGLYLKALSNCYLKLKEKMNKKSLIQGTDYFCFHCPFAKMVQKAYDSLLKIENPQISSQEALKKFYAQVEPSLFLSQRFGNIYNGSLYLCLLSLFYRSKDLTNKKALLFSYGSGMCSTMIEIHIKSNPVCESQKIRLQSFLESRVKISAKEYSEIMQQKEKSYNTFKGVIKPNFDYINDDCFYLQEVDAKWRRKYAFHQNRELSLAKNNISFIERIPGLNAKMVEPLDGSKFYKMSVEDRQSFIINNKNIKLDVENLNSGGISIENANTMIENVIGKIALPLAVVPSLKINEKDYTVPMCIEEPSVVAAVNSIAKLIAPYGIKSVSSKCQMLGQVHLIDLEPSDSIQIQKREAQIVASLNEGCQRMVARGGGVKQILLRKLSSGEKGKGNYSLDIVIDVCDAMGANIVNTLAEKAKNIIANMGIKTGISILSNYCTRRITYSTFMIPIKALAWKGVQGEEVAQKIIEAYKFAKIDKFRAVTHNKGIMNGIDAVCLATGQDWRAVQSAAHAYATEMNSYSPLTHYEIIEENGVRYFKGMLNLPMAVGTVGGSVYRNPLYQESLNLLGNPNSQQLAQVITSVGLCQNLAALRALAIEGIQKGHMRLHARAIGAKNGIPEHLLDECCKFMQTRKQYTCEAANLFLQLYSKPKL